MTLQGACENFKGSLDRSDSYGASYVNSTSYLRGTKNKILAATIGSLHQLLIRECGSTLYVGMAYIGCFVFPIHCFI